MTEEDFDCDSKKWMITFGVFIGISQILLAFTIMSILMYCLDTGFADVHIALCTFGFHLAAEGILTMNAVSGCLDERRVIYRVYAHAFLQLCAVVCILTGTISVALETGIHQTSHGISGIVTTVLTVLTMFGGITSLLLGCRFRMMHIVLGIPTILTSAVCLFSAFRKPKLTTWVNDTLPADSDKVLIMFICIYTILIFSMSFMKLVLRLNTNTE